jgi:polyhydroxybutyrate depolymerase
LTCSRTRIRIAAAVALIGCTAAACGGTRTDSAAGTDDRAVAPQATRTQTSSLRAAPGSTAASVPPPSTPSAPASTASPIPVPTGTPLPVDANVIGQTFAVQIGDARRTYQVVLPPHPLAARLPVVIVLAGSGAPISDEERRTGLLPEVEAGKVILVYPVDDVGSWNMGSCCGKAQRLGIDDVDFVTTVLAQIRARPDVLPDEVVLSGYSNGARLAFDIACRNPTAVRALITVAGVPALPCAPGPAIPLLEIAGTDDPELAYNSSDPRHWLPGFKEPTVIGEAISWLRRNGCSDTPVEVTRGTAHVTTWSDCRSGATVEVAGYDGIQHLWPYGGPNTPSAARLMLEFMTRNGIAGL